MTKFETAKFAPHIKLEDMSIKHGRGDGDLAVLRAQPRGDTLIISPAEVGVALFDALRMREEVGPVRSANPGPPTGRFRLDALVITANARAEAHRRGINTNVFNN